MGDKKVVKFKDADSNIAESVKKALSEVSRMSTPNQILVGGSSGVLTGYLVSKVSKLFAFTIGGGIIILQVAQHFGYVQINWKKFQKDVKKHQQRTVKALGKSGKEQAIVERVINDGKTFIQDNLTFCGSFLGGFLISFAF
jgi:FUN14 domain-containing protein 1